MSRLYRSAQGPALAILACLALLSLAPVHAATLVQLQELPALVDEAHRGVLATVAGVHHDYDARGLHATFVKLRIDEPLFGAVPDAGEFLEIKLYGAPVEMPDGGRLFVEGTPRYGVGQRYLLLLREDSAWGFTNVSGLFMGAFRIESEPSGDENYAESLAGNRVFGEGGLSRFIEAEDPAEEPYLQVTDRPVPYPMLRRAVLKLDAERSGGAR
ncbi:hypothetical protein ABI59_23715 [Acidobacteria bacterium Mor1]|nr:hypothetical protein ABI59_23715 [Acidobacteria bacterium Mor1]